MRLQLITTVTLFKDKLSFNSVTLHQNIVSYAINIQCSKKEVVQIHDVKTRVMSNQEVIQEKTKSRPDPKIDTFAVLENSLPFSNLRL